MISVCVLSPSKHEAWLQALRSVVGEVRVETAPDDLGREAMLAAGQVDAIVVNPVSTRASRSFDQLRSSPASPAQQHDLFGLWKAPDPVGNTVSVSCRTIVHWIYDNVTLALPPWTGAVCISNPLRRRRSLESSEVAYAILPVGFEPLHGWLLQVITSTEAPAPVVAFLDPALDHIFESAAARLGFPPGHTRAVFDAWEPSALAQPCDCGERQ